MIEAMNFSVPTRSLSPARQGLLIVAVLFGVLLMHDVATGNAVHMRSPQPMSDHGDALERLDPATHPATDPDILSSGIEVAPLPGHPLVVVCKAVLVAGLTLPLLGYFRVKRRATSLTLPAKLWHRRSSGAAIAAWLQRPSLARLCISRT